MHFNFEGYFNLVVRDAKTMDVKRETGFFKNIITDYGLNRLGTTRVLIGAAVGTGTATPVATDTTLQSELAFTTAIFNVSAVVGPNVEPYYGGVVKTFRFAEGAAAGNLSEVGIVATNTGGVRSLWSRSLILDSSGNPTTITVLPNEVLDVVYEARAYAMPNTSTGGPITLLGVDYNWSMRAINVRVTPQSIFEYGVSAGVGWYAFSGDMVDVTEALPGGLSVGVGSLSTAAAYANNSLKRQHSISWNITQGNGNNAAGIKTVRGGICPGSSVEFQIGFDKIFPKDATNTLSITYEISWGRKEI